MTLLSSAATHDAPRASYGRGRHLRPCDQRHDVGEHLSRHYDLGHLEGDVAVVADVTMAPPPPETNGPKLRTALQQNKYPVFSSEIAAANRSTTAIAPGPKPSADHSIASDRATGASEGSTRVAVVASRLVAAALDGLEAAAFAHSQCRR